MTPDKDIQELFDSVNIPFADNDAFLETLSQRLKKVEFIKETHDAQIKRYKVSVFYSLITGLAVGAGSMAFLQVQPAVPLEKISSVLSGITMLETAYPIVTVNMGIALLSGIAAFLIVRNYQEIRSIFDKPTEYLNM
ncbi:MAG: hypothetical protein MJY97_00135 [Bacteroidales bacterium]|nr:hypothetical protein [Bacteroidales bacterium]